MRISGIASGMDTDTMVQSMMKAERMKLTRFEQSKQIALWRQESYNTVNKMFANFILNTKKDIGLKTTTSKGISFDKSYTSLDYVKKATSSNELAATVSSTSKAVNGSFSIEVEKLATSGTVASADLSGVAIEKGMSFKINDEVITVGQAGATVNMNDVVKAINDKKDITGVTAFYDETNKKLFMQTMETGAPKSPKTESIKIETSGSSSGNVFLAQMQDEGNGYINKKGEDARVKFNGVMLNYSSNNFNLNGVNIELKTEGVTTNINVTTNVDGIMDKVKKLVEDYNALIDITSGLLGEKKYSSYKPLSDEDRTAMKENDVKLWDEKAKSGILNSDETISRTLQIMRNNLYKDLESKVKIDENGKKTYDGFGHITQIGISTVAYARGTAGGKLQIDEEKLRKAIEQDAEGVMELLFTEPDKLQRDNSLYPDTNEGNRAYEVANKAHRSNNSGIFTRIYDDLADGMKSIIEKSGTGGNSDLYRNVRSNILIDFVTTKSSISDIDKSIAEMNRKMDNLNILFAKKEESYYAKFTQMEKYMQQMSSQSSWIGQQLMR